ncbi:DUF4372 domain-containing protein [Desulfobulbus oligotrophicus]|uniref:DUF4372 domain-containing protein n=1 Tax=Desulfobulbus oligotrophicus TaxID=1909699 RepID=A0A7T5VD20_9BACT|nr:DUF4372 domain-containing protein [Desulfobulbus oligotrophicus]
MGQVPIGKLVFAQGMEHMSSAVFCRCMATYQGSRQVSMFTCLDQFLCMRLFKSQTGRAPEPQRFIHWIHQPLICVSLRLLGQLSADKKGVLPVSDDNYLQKIRARVLFCLKTICNFAGAVCPGKTCGTSIGLSGG